MTDSDGDDLAWDVPLEDCLEIYQGIFCLKKLQALLFGNQPEVQCSKIVKFDVSGRRCDAG